MLHPRLHLDRPRALDHLASISSDKGAAPASSRRACGGPASAVRADGLRGVFLRSGRGQAPTDYPLNKRVNDPKDQYRTKRKKNRKEKKVEQNNKEDLKLSHHTVFIQTSIEFTMSCLVLNITKENSHKNFLLHS